jgi:hypothetical protein
MPERRSTRFLFEALFLVGLAVALSFADVRPIVIVGVMFVGWVFAALFEWASLRGEPHFGRGLPPRYFVPQISLPPARPLERPADVFPVAPSPPADVPTWIVPAGEAYDWPWLREGEQIDETQVVEVVEVVEAATIVARIAVEEPQHTAPPRARPRVAGTRTARHRIDPLAPPAQGRGRRRVEESGVLDVPDRPAHRVLPGSARRGED